MAHRHHPPLRAACSRSMWRWRSCSHASALASRRSAVQPRVLDSLVPVCVSVVVTGVPPDHIPMIPAASPATNSVRGSQVVPSRDLADGDFSGWDAAGWDSVGGDGASWDMARDAATWAMASGAAAAWAGGNHMPATRANAARVARYLGRSEP